MLGYVQSKIVKFAWGMEIAMFSNAMQLSRLRKQHGRLVPTVCVSLSLVFLTSAITKLRSFDELQSTLAASRLVPVVMVSQAGTLLLVTEFLLALLLLLPATRRSALYAATVLVSVFAAYSTWRWRQGIVVPCHCFGALFKMEPWQGFAVNIVLLVLIGRSIVQDAEPPIESHNTTI